MTRRVCVLLAVVGLLSAGPGSGQPPAELDRYGGWTGMSLAATGHFRVARADGRWCLADPEGRPFFSLGVNVVSFRADRVRGTNQSPYCEAAAAKHGRQSNWARAAVRRLRGWGFNTLGAWSDRVACQQGMPYTLLLDFSHRVAWREGQTFPDVFDPSFARAARALAQRVCRPLAGDPWLVGYFTDNELRWGPDWRSEDSLFIEFLGLPDEAAGRQALVQFLQERYGSVERLNEEWRTRYDSFQEVGRTPQAGSRIPEDDQEGFLGLVAGRYFATVEEAVRAADPNHLILGCRFAGYAPGAVLEAMRDRVDVVSLNHYGERPPVESLREIHRVTGRPILVSEFSVRARDSGLPNSRGEGALVDTQGERAAHAQRYLRHLLALPMVVGYHWFQHCDQPAEGRFDGENSNYGLVTIADEPYAPLVAALTGLNTAVYAELQGREE